MDQSTLQLTPDEEVWLNAYQKTLREQFEGLLVDLIVFGSKARGVSTDDSDLDIVVIIRDGDWKQKQAIADMGNDLAIGTSVVPSVIVFTQQEWHLRAEEEAPFWQTVQRDGVTVV